MFKDVTLKQSYKIIFRREFKLVGNKKIEVHFRSPFGSKIRTFLLKDINPLFMRHKEVDTKSFKYFCYMFSASIVCFLISSGLSPSSAVQLITTGVLFLIVSLLILLASYLNSVNFIVFFALQSNFSILEIDPSKPSKDEVNDFVNELIRRMKSIHYPEHLTKNQLNEVYIKHLDFLCDHKVITDEEHSNIISRLLNRSKESNVIPFNVD